jgi:hypothetical protein|uniref:hypothetical protein n=1 Tax=Prosthecobacter sp. TaxID=1965333 RepID=UPI0037840749
MPDEPLHFSDEAMDEDAGRETADLKPWIREIFEAHHDYLLEASQGEINETKDEERFQKQLRDWLCKLPDEATTPVFLRLRDIILEVAERQGIVEAKDLPPDLQFTLSELSLTLAGQLIQSVNARITKELRHLRPVERIAFYDQVIDDLTLAETYALDAMPPERTGFLKSARSIRADCHRACQALRRHHRQ